MGLQRVTHANQASRFIDEILEQNRELQARLAQLESVEGARYLKLVENNVSNPPTDAELDAIFGTPATVGKGFISLINDNGASSNFYLVTSDGSAWWLFTGTKAV